MDMEGKTQDHPEYGDSLRRVGVVLMFYGFLVIAQKIVAMFGGGNITIGDGPAYIVAGIFLWKFNLRSAHVIRLLAAMTLVAEAVSMVSYPAMLPSDLIRTYLRVIPVGDLLLKHGIDAMGIVVAWWVYRSLGAPQVKAAISAAGKGSRRWWLQPWAGLIYGAVIPLLLVVTVYNMSHGDTAAQAVEQARSRYGSEYRYWVSSLETKSSFGGDKTVHVVLLKYSDTTIEPVALDWTE